MSIQYVVYAKKYNKTKFYQGHCLAIEDGECIYQHRTGYTYVSKDVAIDTADEALASWQEDYELAEANAR